MTTAEEFYGSKAGAVWQALNGSGPMTEKELTKATGLKAAQVHGALGWLAREDKLILESKGKITTFMVK